jgi:hypothetical protein
MSVLDAPCVSPVSVSVATTEVLQRKQHNPVLQRLRRLMDSAGEETDADSESLELALLDVELTKYAGAAKDRAAVCRAHRGHTQLAAAQRPASRNPSQGSQLTPGCLPVRCCVSSA